jgi:hypothetical protein
MIMIAMPRNRLSPILMRLFSRNFAFVATYELITPGADRCGAVKSPHSRFAAQKIREFLGFL